jgi:hypothetical protein
MAYQFGDVLLVPFPFTDQSASKQRPGVIVSSATYHRARRDLVLMPITSQLRGSGAFGEVMVQDWQAAKLLKPSAIKPVFAAGSSAGNQSARPALGTRCTGTQTSAGRTDRLMLHIFS